MQIPGSVNIEIEEIITTYIILKGTLSPLFYFTAIPPPINSSPSILTLSLLVQTSVSKLYLYKTIETIFK